MKSLDVIFYRVNQTGLIFLNGAANLGGSNQKSASSAQSSIPVAYLGSHEKRVELGKDSKHFLCIASRSESIPKTRDDLVLDTSHTFIISAFSCDPNLSAFCLYQN